MARSFRGSWLLLLPAIAAAAPAGGPTGEQVLRRAAAASRRVAYRGTRLTTLWLERRTEAFEANEYSDGRGKLRLEYLAPPAMRGRVVVDDGTHRWQIDPGSRRILQSAGSTKDDPGEGDTALLLRNYTVSLDAHRQSLARRPAYRLRLTPLRAGKPRETWWVDAKTWLVLKREVRHADGAPSRITSFSEIDYSRHVPPSRFVFRPGAAQRVVSAPAASPCPDPADASRFLGRQVSLPARLPSLGFERREVFCGEEHGRRRLHFLYDDGLTTLSVFVDRQKLEPVRGTRRVSLDGHTARLQTDGHFAVLRWSVGGLRYTVIGDLTVPALLRIGHDLNGR